MMCVARAVVAVRGLFCVVRARSAMSHLLDGARRNRMTARSEAPRQVGEESALGRLATWQDEEHGSLGECFGDGLPAVLEEQETRRHEGNVVERHTPAPERCRWSLELPFHIPFIISLTDKFDSA